MKILIYEWNGYCYSEIKNVLKENHIAFDVLRFLLPNVFCNNEFEHILIQKLMGQSFDAVFSFDYFPIVARCCKNSQVPYLSWCYDSRLEFKNTDETLGFPTNHIFFFDRVQADYYKSAGLNNIHHLPLAANTKRLSQIYPSAADVEKYGADISFVGQLYESEYDTITMQLSPYLQGYLKAIADAQFKLYGCYLIEDMISEQIVAQVNEQFTKGQNLQYFTKDQVVSVLNHKVTNTERLLLLSLLSRHFPTKLYAPNSHPVLNKIIHMDTVTYMDYMPIVFKTAKINLNVTLKSIASGIPLRAMDILGCGGFLLSNFQLELNEYFIDGKEIVQYTDIHDAYEKAAFYLSHEHLRSSIANAGFHKVNTQFTYDIQLAKMLKTAGLQ